ncbi:hypothetical protein [Burkholderia sp. Bp9140]|uniref:hypothetical protein n=1 Tax=Burkholderia sp. Bp9140 TaxID=2184572 RepID=UPI001628A964|nr:hypothetical protein [Burkholderia sp. Bp9140]
MFEIEESSLKIDTVAVRKRDQRMTVSSSLRAGPHRRMNRCALLFSIHDTPMTCFSFVPHLHDSNGSQNRQRAHDIRRPHTEDAARRIDWRTKRSS